MFQNYLIILSNCRTEVQVYLDNGGLYSQFIDAS